MNKVYVKLPKTGLGNLLLVWARGCVFAHLNDLPLVTSSWWGIRPGPWIRNEQRKRVYYNYFNESPFISRMMIRFRIKIKKVTYDPELKKLDSLSGNYVFTQMTNNEELFTHLHPHKKYLKEQLNAIVHSSIRKKLDESDKPIIAVHIRKGDFKLFHQDTSISYFVETLRKLRKALNSNLKATIFSDAGSGELSEILSEPNVTMAQPAKDLTDLLLMSEAQFLIMSKSSSFSYWAAFLGEGYVIKHANDWQAQIAEIKAREYRSDAIFDFDLKSFCTYGTDRF